MTLQTEFGVTHGPCACNAGNNATADQHWPEALGALEDGAAQGAGEYAVGHVVLPPHGANGAVYAVIDHGYYARRVAQEGAAAGD